MHLLVNNLLSERTKNGTPPVYATPPKKNQGIISGNIVAISGKHTTHDHPIARYIVREK